MGNWKKLFNLQVKLTGEDVLKQIPAKPGIVLIADANENPIQMITAADMRARVRHKLSEPLCDDDSPVKISRRVNLSEIARLVLCAQTTSAFENDWKFLEFANQIWPKRFGKIVSAKPPWFVAIDIAEPYPHFFKTRNFAEFKTAVGPFAKASEADKFIDALADSFDLCRSLACLRKSPNGSKCAYAEMNRCVSPSDGTISMNDYREILKRAYDFAANDRETLEVDFKNQMQQAAQELDFERAGMLKNRINRLAFFRSASYIYVRPKQQFKFLMILPGSGKREFKAFGINMGEIFELGKFAWPDENAGEKLLQSANDFFAKPVTESEISSLKMGIVTRYLFAGDNKRGLVLDWNISRSKSEIQQLIETCADRLKLSQPKAKTADISPVSK